MKGTKEIKMHYSNIFEHRSMDRKISIYLEILFLDYLLNPSNKEDDFYFLQESFTLLVHESESIFYLLFASINKLILANCSAVKQNINNL